MNQEDLELKLENAIKEIVLIFDNLEKIFTGEITTLHSTDLFPVMSIFVSTPGLRLQERINEVLRFWMGLFFPRFSGHVLIEYSKFIVAGIIGDESYQKLRKIIVETQMANKSQKNVNLIPKPEISNKEFNFLGSMTVMTFAGYIEDYFDELKGEIFNNMISQENNTAAMIFIERFSRAWLTNRVNILLEGMGIKNSVSKNLQKYSGWSFRKRFDEFREIRNTISHTSRDINYIALNPEVVSLSKFIKNTIILQTEVSKEIPPSQKEIILNMIDPLLPIISYLFVLYRKILPYLTVLDYSYSLWNNILR
jgi:hypothetical protein